MSAGWIELTVQCPSEDLAGLVAEGLVAYGASAVEELPGVVRTWLPCGDAATPESIAVAALAALQRHAGRSLSIDWCIRAETDWSAAWREGLQPRRVGARIVVAPTWATPELRPGDVLLAIDPEMAFGTGEHATTRGMLRLLQQVNCVGARVLDVGTGSAILAIAAALLGAAHVDAVESDADALMNARDNVQRHDSADRVRLQHALVDAEWLAGREVDYDIVLANILSGVIRPLLPAFHAALRPGGALLVSGILDVEADRVGVDAASAGFSLCAVDREDEWWSAYFERA